MIPSLVYTSLDFGLFRVVRPYASSKWAVYYVLHGIIEQKNVKYEAYNILTVRIIRNIHVGHIHDTYYYVSGTKTRDKITAIIISIIHLESVETCRIYNS